MPRGTKVSLEFWVGWVNGTCITWGRRCPHRKGHFWRCLASWKALYKASDFVFFSWQSATWRLRTRMWANAQRDVRPAKHRWHLEFNAAKFGWRSLLDCRAVMLPRHRSRWKYLGWPKLMKRSQPLVDRSSPYCGDMWRRYCCLTSFFSRLSIHAYLWRYSQTKLCDGAQMAIFKAIFGSCISSKPRTADFRPAF